VWELSELDLPWLSFVVLVALSAGLDLLLCVALPGHLGMGCGGVSACFCAASCMSLGLLRKMSMSKLRKCHSLHSLEPLAGCGGDSILVITSAGSPLRRNGKYTIERL
jgi:hypothetical protein